MNPSGWEEVGTVNPPASSAGWEEVGRVNPPAATASSGGWEEVAKAPSEDTSLLPNHPINDLIQGLKGVQGAAAGMGSAVGDWGTSLGGMIAGGYAGLGKLATGSSLGEAVDEVHKREDASQIGKQFLDAYGTPESRKAYELTNLIPNKLAEALQAAGPAAHKALGTSQNALEQATDEPLATLGSFFLLHKLGTGLSSATIKARSTVKGVGYEEAPDSVFRNSETAYDAAKGDLGPEEPSVPPEATVKPRIKARGVVGAVTEDALAEEAPKAPEETLKPAEEATTPAPEAPEAPTEAPKAVQEAPTGRQEPQIGPETTPEDQAYWDQFQQDHAESAGSSPVDQTVMPGGISEGFKRMAQMKGQGGAVGDLADAQRLDELVKNLMVTDRDPANVAKGDTVRLMNGKVGRVMNVSEDGRYQIKHDDGSFDSVPRQGINYKFKPANQIVNPVGYKGGVGKKAFGQSGSAEIFNFGRKRAELRPYEVKDLSVEDINYETPKYEGDNIVGKETKPLGGVGKKGFGQGGAIKNIFKADDPNIEADRPEPTAVEYTKQGIHDTLFKYWNQSGNFRDFLDGLLHERRYNPAFPEQAIREALVWWNKFEKGWKPEASNFSRLGTISQRETADQQRPYEQFVKESKDLKQEITDPKTGEKKSVSRQLTARDDIGLLKREGFSPQHMSSVGYESNFGTKLIKWGYSHLADIRNQARIKLGELMQMKNPMMDLPRQSMIRVLKAQWEWDSGKLNDMLWSTGADAEGKPTKTVASYWPTKDQLMEHSKLNSAEADAYLSQAKAFDEMYRLAGIERPKLPGYFPHTWHGLWRVYIFDKEAGLFKVMGASTRWGARSIAKAALEEGKANGREVFSQIHTPELGQKHDFVNRISNDLLTALQGQGKLGATAAKLLIRLQDRVMEGTITESLERHGIGGYEIESGPKPENTILQKVLNRKYNNNLFKIFDRAMTDGVRAWKNRTITQVVAKPFFEDAKRYQSMPNATKAMKDLIEKATGFNKQEFSAFERSVRQFFINVGLPHNIPSSMLNALNSFARVERINSFNLGFAGEHAYFALPGLIDMYRQHIDRYTMGEKTGNFWQSMGMWAKGWLPGDVFRSADEAAAMKWFKNRGGFKGNYYDAVQHTPVADALTHGSLQLVINRAKAATFSMSYHYFKEIMPKQQALDAAYNHTMKTMQSFDALDTPEVFGEGMIGKSVRPFNQIHMYSIARLAASLESIKLAVKNNPKMLPLAMTPLAALLGSYALLGGAKGLIFHDDWDKIRKWLNENSSTHFPGYEEMMLKAGAPDWLVYGAIPNAVHLPGLPGSDTRGTFTMNVGGLLSGAGLEAGTRLAELAWQYGRQVITGQGNADEIHRLTRSLLPSTVIPWYEQEEATKLGGQPLPTNLKDRLTTLGTGKGNIPEPSRLNPMSPRSPKEDLEYKLLSKKPISESIRNEKVALMKEIDAENEKHNAQIIRTLTNKILGFDTGRKSIGDIIQDAVKEQRGLDVDTVLKRIADGMPKRIIPAAIQYLDEVEKSSNDEQTQNRVMRLQQFLRDGKTLGE